MPKSTRCVLNGIYLITAKLFFGYISAKALSFDKKSEKLYGSYYLNLV